MDRRELAELVLQDLIFEISTSVAWRARLFAAEDGARFEIPEEEVARLSAPSRGSGLRFAVFRDGLTEDDNVVFGFEAIGLPDLTVYSTNNPHVP